MVDITRPFQNKLWYYDVPLGTAYGTCPTLASTAKPVSCEWRVARISMSDKHVVNYGASTPAPTTLWEQIDDFKFHLEYVPQCDDTLLTNCINRLTDGYFCDVRSFSFILGLNTCHARITDQTWYMICGAKPDTIRLAASTNNKWVATIDFLVSSVVTSGDTDTFITNFDAPGLGLTDLLAEEPNALTGAYLGFNVAGHIGKNNVTDDFAYIVNNADILIEHNLCGDGFNHDSKTREYAVAGRWAGSGTIDLSLDSGGGQHWWQVMNKHSFDVYVCLGAVGCPQIVLPSCEWVSPEISVEVDDCQLMRSAAFNSAPSNCTDASKITHICYSRVTA